MNDVLYHHGVKGMKWGRRKSKNNKKRTKKTYKSTNKADIRDYGTDGANRIEKRMAEKGLTRKQARSREYLRSSAKKQAIGAAVTTALFAVTYPEAAKFVASMTARGGAAVAGTVAGKAVGAAKKATGGYSGNNAAKFVMSTLRNNARGVTYAAHKSTRRATKFLN